MLSAILGIAVPVALKLLEYFLDKSKAKKEVWAAFYEFVKKFQAEGAKKSVKLKKSYEAQLARIQAKVKAAAA